MRAETQKTIETNVLTVKRERKAIGVLYIGCVYECGRTGERMVCRGKGKTELTVQAARDPLVHVYSDRGSRLRGCDGSLDVSPVVGVVAFAADAVAGPEPTDDIPGRIELEALGPAGCGRVAAGCLPCRLLWSGRILQSAALARDCSIGGAEASPVW